MSSSSAIARAIEASILDYLREHPDAADSDQGIERWWLSRGLADHPLSDVGAVIRSMVERRLLSAVVLPDGTFLYQQFQEDR